MKERCFHPFKQAHFYVKVKKKILDFRNLNYFCALKNFGLGFKMTNKSKKLVK